MKITHVGPSRLPLLFQYGGAIQRRIVELAKTQAERGHEVTVYSPGATDQAIDHMGVEVRCIPCKSQGILGDIEFQLRAVRDMGNREVDILHFHSNPEGAALSQGIPARKVLSYDNYFFRRGRQTPLYLLYRSFLKRFDLLLPCSQYTLDESRRYWRLGPSRIRVLYNGVNLRQFHPDPALRAAERGALGINTEKHVILYLGRVCWQKGSDVLLDASRRLSAKRHDIQLVVAGPIGQFGNDSRSAFWAERIREVGGSYLGAVSERRVAAVLNMADVFVMPTRELEMFGMAAVEAQACGKPVVASDHGGLRETVPEACGGRFPTGDSEALASKIEELVDHADVYRRCSANALANAAKYSWEQICTALDSLYRMPAVGEAQVEVLKQM